MLIIPNVITFTHVATSSGQNANNLMDAEEEGEKSEYHVLERPGKDDYEDPDREQSEEMAGGVTEYEIPVPMKRANMII